MAYAGILIDQATGDLDITQGKISLGDNRLQIVEQVIMSNRGEYKEFPLIGGELMKQAHGQKSRFWVGRIKNMCRIMGVPVRHIKVSVNGMINVEL